MTLEPVNQNLRSGGIRSLVVLGAVTAGNALVMADRMSRPDTPSHWVWVGISTLLGTVLIALTWTALRNLQTRFTEEGVVVTGPGTPTTLRWADVVRVRADSWRIILERVGGAPVVISLLHVRQPDELHHALRTLVPNRALQRINV